MEYKGKLYIRLAGQYLPSGKTSDDWDAMEEDIQFLASRGLKASSINFGDHKRDTGASSNSIVGIAYGIIELKDQELPGDLADMLACERMWQKLPEHRKKGDAKKAMKKAREHDYVGKEHYMKYAAAEDLPMIGEL